jgi:hypothetical protein
MAAGIPQSQGNPLGNWIDRILTPKYVNYPPYEGAEKVCVNLNPAPLYQYENRYKSVIKA